MTDKEQTNDSLKNQDKNFNENCTHEKEQIIINGVNVSKCKYHNNGWCELPESTDDARNKPCGDMTLFDCYYKQLARKTQELKTICKAFDIEYGYDEGTGVIVGRCNKLIEKENELEEYKQSLNERNKFLQDLGISGGEFKRIKFYIESLKNKYNENARYRKALEEIGKIVKINCKGICGRKFEDCNDFLCSSKNILDIINKAKGEGNEE